MYSWTAFLIDASWVGAFVMVAVMSGLEGIFPRLQKPAIARPPNILFGITTLVALLFGSFAISEPITRIAYQVQIVSVSDLPLSAVWTIALGVVLIDLLAYASHYLSHKVPLLWRLHQVHHAETFVTASTGLLHHPLESLFLYGFILAGAVFFGVPVGALMIYAAVNALHSVFAHSNVRLPGAIGRILGMLIVTPDIHRIHHSVDPAEGNSNFGQILSVWDRLFGTYRARAAREGDDFRMGLDDMKEEDLAFVPLLRKPFGRR
ncbi:sterol desaturase family protein [Phreatobacter sp. HK31-P]